MSKKKIKVALIFGTRPEAIKMAPIVKEFEKYPSNIRTIVIVTAQHRQLLDQILSLFKIKVDYDLDIMSHNQTLFDIISVALMRIQQVLAKEKPDLVLVQGDTTTSFVAALASTLLKIPVGHVEAGLRTFNKLDPFPEELNRRLTSVVANLHFAPTKTSQRHLCEEKIDPKTIFVTGNTVIDALLMVVRRNFDFKKLKDTHLAEKLSKVDFHQRVILVTAHRRESFGKPFLEICKAIKEIVDKNKDVEVIYPVHLNPNVQAPVNKILKGLNRVRLLLHSP